MCFVQETPHVTAGVKKINNEKKANPLSIFTD